MATTVISVEDYLRSTSEPDHEFVHGGLKKRAMPEWDHSQWQSALIVWFGQHGHAWGIRAMPELRVRVAVGHFRIPDVTIVSRQAPREPYLTHAPLAVFEILSPGDSMTDLYEKLAAYEAMGIPAIWVIDPAKNTYRRYVQGKLTEATIFDLPGTDFTVPVSEIAALAD
jgi:Uma2 family endonuclease